MENDIEGSEIAVLSEVRLILIGGRWAGKSFSGNTILGKDQFECGRTRTSQTEVSHELVEGRRLVVVDSPGWSSSLSLNEIPEGDKRRFKLNASKCPPGPHVFLLVVPVDSAFSVESRRTVEEHMKLLGERVWRYTVVLFTCGDFLGEKTIEQHIESEGDSLRWLMERCSNRYHVFNNKDRADCSQVTQLLQKVDEVAWNNGGRCYQVDEQTLSAIKEKQEEVAKRAKERKTRSDELRRQMRALIPEERKTLPDLRMVLLGSRSVGKTSAWNSILGFKDQEDGKRTARSVARRGFVGETEITIVDTPGWWKGFSVLDTPEATKEELVRSPFLCPPGPHVFLLAIDADASFNGNHLDAVTSHVELLGEGVWGRTIVVFTRGDWLGSHTVEEFIEGEGEALRTLVDRCANRYHVINNKHADYGTQITELLEKITETVAVNGWDCFVPDDKIFRTIEERRSSVVDYLRNQENFERMQLKLVLKRRLLEEYMKRELEQMKGFRETLIQLAEVKESLTTTKSKSLTKGIGHRRKDGKEKEDILDLKFSQEIEKLDKLIEAKSLTLINGSINIFRPNLKGESPAPSDAGSLPERENPTSPFNNVLGWLSTLQIGTNFDNQMTLKFSRTSGYGSVLQSDDLYSEIEENS